MKSKSTAYLLWFFLGVLGAHKFYLGKFGIGVLYLFTLGLFGFGLLIDLFTLGGQVDTYNALMLGKSNAMNSKNTNMNNIVVNVPAPSPIQPLMNTQQTLSTSEQLQKLSELRDQFIISEEEFELQKAKVLAL